MLRGLVLALLLSAATGSCLALPVAIGRDQVAAVPDVLIENLTVLPPVRKPMPPPTEANVLETYADIALAGYQDALEAATKLDAAIDDLILNPSLKTLVWAQVSWRLARIPYQQTEVFRFGNPVVESWHGRVNAALTDEGMIDYAAIGHGERGDANIIANPRVVIDGIEIDARELDAEFLRDILDHAGGIPTGYHVIEFLLWGQDINGTRPGVGMRPFTDYSTDPHAERRAAYLKAASTLLVRDLEEMVANWEQEGAARTALRQLGLAVILTGMGSLGRSEMAGRRMEPSLTLHDPEQEEDRFSDYTHISLLMNGVGIRNVYLGRYLRTDGSLVEGASLRALLDTRSPALADELNALIVGTVTRLTAISNRAHSSGQFYDEQIGAGNPGGNGLVRSAIDALIAQTDAIERAADLLELSDAVVIDGSSRRDGADALP